MEGREFAGICLDGCAAAVGLVAVDLDVFDSADFYLAAFDFER